LYRLTQEGEKNAVITWESNTRRGEQQVQTERRKNRGRGINQTGHKKREGNIEVGVRGGRGERQGGKKEGEGKGQNLLGSELDKRNIDMLKKQELKIIGSTFPEKKDWKEEKGKEI